MRIVRIGNRGFGRSREPGEWGKGQLGAGGKRIRHNLLLTPQKGQVNRRYTAKGIIDGSLLLKPITRLLYLSNSKKEKKKEVSMDCFDRSFLEMASQQIPSFVQISTWKS